MTAFTINGRRVDVAAEPDAPLLWVIREHLKLTGTKMGGSAVAPAIANGVAALTGKRLRHQPMSPARVLEALRA
jgi:aerobic-type carbon monoxide dehydrogenase small subunit (CoxS/CutS family)